MAASAWGAATTMQRRSAQATLKGVELAIWGGGGSRGVIRRICVFG